MRLQADAEQSCISNVGQMTGPFFSGNGMLPAARDRPILSSISSRVASITAGEHPIPARGTIFFSCPQLFKEVCAPSRIGGKTKQAHQGGPNKLLCLRFVIHHERPPGTPIAMEPGRYGNDMAQRLLERRKIQVSFVAGGIGPKPILCFEPSGNCSSNR